MRRSWLVAAAFAAAVPSASTAEVASSTDSGFVVTLAADIAAPRAEVWKALVMPSRWWSGEHTYSGDAANLYIDSQATGCFCEKLPRPADAPADQRMGSVEHMHIVYADPQRGVLRLTGGLGPLQGEPAQGVLTITLKDADGGTRIEWDYAVNGLMRAKGSEVAPLVDTVLGQQLARLSGLFASAPAAGG
ncbi:MAG: SRPBCC family protein [Novosphingobium sp.]